MKTIHKLKFLMLFYISSMAYGQTEGVSIKNNPSAPHASAMLDVESSSKGILIPRVNLTSTTSSAPISNSPTTGLLVFNLTNSVSIGLTQGFYFWDGTTNVWKQLSTSIGTELWKTVTTNTNSIYYNPPTPGGTVTVGTPTTSAGSYSTTFKVFGPSIFFSMGATASSPPSPNMGIIVGDKNNAPGQCSSGSAGGHWNEINVPMATLDLQWNTGQNVQIGAHAGSNLYVQSGCRGGGDIFAAGTLHGQALNLSSDSTLKKDIIPFHQVINDLSNCNVYTYHFKTEASTSPSRVGIIAQEIELVFPELIRTVSDTLVVGDKFATSPSYQVKTHKTVDYPGLTAVLLQAIKQQRIEIDELKSQVQFLLTR